jgi:hypothetical protein
VILADDVGVGPLFDPLVREMDDPGRDADEGGREADMTGTRTDWRGEIISESVRDEPARGRPCGLK